jgi:hypothetical protein
MWLLDVNLPTALLGVLRSYGIDCDTAANRGWRDLTNGALAETAFRAGFRVVLTRDRAFGESAAKALRSLPNLAVVVVTLPQARGAGYVAEFAAEFATRWKVRPIEPVGVGWSSGLDGPDPVLADNRLYLPPADPRTSNRQSPAARAARKAAAIAPSDGRSAISG